MFLVYLKKDRFQRSQECVPESELVVVVRGRYVINAFKTFLGISLEHLFPKHSNSFTRMEEHQALLVRNVLQSFSSWLYQW